MTGSDCATTFNTNGATGVDFTAEPNPNASIFTGGGSKDPIDISSWAWKDGAGGLPDKDNLLHEFAARYSVPSNTNCPGVGGETAGATNCDVLFFGSDRLDNSGDAQQGFWFFQNKIGLGSNSVGGGSGFTGVHKPGDILIISDFSNGGTTSSITVLKWDPTCTATNKPTLDCADGNLRTLGTNATAKCTAAAPHDAFCGLVNPGTITLPWAFTDKSGTAGNGALNGEFYEGGINLSAFNLGGECFSSVAAETRSSTSTTAVLKDFVLGGFGQCSATFATTPSGNTQLDGVSGSVKVHDTLSIGVSGNANPPAPTGSVKFYLCGPSSTALTSCDATGTLENTVNLSGATKSGATYSLGSGDVTLTASGYYCWFASWPGDGNYTAGPYTDGTSTECFSVSQPTSVSTTLHETDANGADLNPTHNGTAITINNDSHVVDYATVLPSGATGSVSFRYYVSSATCLADDGTGGSDGGTGTVSSGSAHGSTLQPASGTYYFRAFFTGTGLFLNSSSDCGEVLTVRQNTSVSTTLHETDVNGADLVPSHNATSITVNAGAYVVDYATVVPSGATGTVSFRYYTDQTVCTGDNSQSAGTTAGSGTVSSGSAHGSTLQLASGTYYFRAFFGGSGLFNNSSSDCGEVLTVRQPTSVSTTLHETDVNGADLVPSHNATSITVNAGAYVVDYATVVPSGATGTVSFRYYTDQTVCTGDNSQSAGTTAGSGTVSGGSAHGSTLQLASGTYYFRAFFTGSGLFNNSSSDCGEVLTVNSFQPSLTSTQTVTITDAATVSASGGGDLAGSLHFQPFSDSGCSTTLGSQVDVAVSGASPQTKSTTTTLTYTTNGAHPVYWKVSYSSTNPAQKSIAATCSESTAITIAGNG